MPPLKDFIARCLGVLDELDELAGAKGNDALDDLNAELEDMLMVLQDIRPGLPGWREELEEALDDLDAVAEDYERLADGPLPETAEPAGRLRRISAMLREDL